MTHNEHSQAKRKPRILRFTLKLLAWLIAIPLFLLLVFFLLLQLPQTQEYLTEKTGNYLSKKIKTKFRLDRISIDFPKALVLEGLYVEDENRDTLLYSKSLKVDVALWDLLSRKVTVNSLHLDTFTGHIERKDSVFNFNFIIKAFTSGSPDTVVKKAAAETNPWQFTVGTVQLNSVYFTYHDAQTGTNADVHLGSFETRIDVLDLSKMKIKIKNVDLKNTSAFYVQNAALKKDTSVSEPLDFDLQVSELNLNIVNFIYKNNVGKQDLAISVGDLFVSSKQLDLKTTRIELDKVVLAKSKISFTSDKKELASGNEKHTTDAGAAKWLVTVNKLELDSNDFTYNDNAVLPAKAGMDYSHLQAKNINFSAKNIYTSQEKIRLDLNHLSLTEKSGLDLKELKAKISYDSAHSELKGLDLRTSESNIKGDFNVRYPSLAVLKDSINTLVLNTDFDNTSISLNDVLLFAPSLSSQPIISAARRNKIRVKGKLRGTTDDLTISELELRLLESTLLKLNGSVKKATDSKNMFLQLQALQLSTTAKDIKTLIPDSLLPKGMTLPETIDLKAFFTGYLKNFNSDLNLKTSLGNVSAKAKMNPKAGNKEQPYELSLQTYSLNLAKLLNQPTTLGPVTLTAGVKGSGMDTSNIHAEISAFVEAAVLKGYEYKALTLTGRIDKRAFTIQSAIDDKNIAFNFDGRINTDPAHPEYIFAMDLKGADLKALNLTEEDLRLSARIESDISDRKRSNPEGKAAIRNLTVLRNSRKYRLDSLVLKSEFKDSIAEISFQSDIFDADFKGNITLSQLPALLQQQVNAYFDMKTPAAKEKLNIQKFKFEMRLKDATLLTQNTIPGLEKLTPFVITGDYNSVTKKVVVDANVPQVIYSGVAIDSLKLTVRADAEKLNANLGAAQISNTTFKFENLSLGTELKNNALTFQLNTNKDDSTKTLAIGGVLKSSAKGYELRINPELVFNGENWSVDAANYMIFGKQGLYANRLVISNNGRSVAVNSAEQREKAPLEIKFTNFDLSVVSKLIENNNELVKGFVDGNVILEERNKAAAFRSDLTIRDFAFKSVPVGTILLKADNYGSSSVYVINLGIEGNGNDIKANGSYNAAVKTNNLDFKLDINNLNLASIEPFTFGQLTRMSGAMSGDISIKGSPAKPELNGNLDFKEATLRPRFIDSYLTVHDGRLNLSSKRLTFNNLAIYDSLNNKALVNGYVSIEDLNALNFDLSVKTTNFLALNTDSKDNPLYYGRIFLDSDIGIRGTAAAPKLNVKAKLNKGSYITYVKPESQVTKNEGKGIIEFVDSLYKDEIMMRVNDSINGSSDIKGMDLNATISFDKTVQLKMFVDPENGDSLYVIGGGTLDFALDPSGKTNLTGRYRINDGGYHLSINDLVKRNFKIESGSSVTWSGDVLDAYVDLKAIYTIKTSPIDLVQNEISGMSDLERNKYRNLLTFNVYLKMTGFISSPEISFDIQLAPGDRGALNGAINSKLAQLREDETELNKQVFALLTLKRFIGENPLDNGSDGGGLTSASRSSASKVLTQQLSNLSDKYVNFVDLDLGVNSFEDYSTGQEQGRTQLQLGVSKQILNDKVSVHVGGNVELEGERAKQNNANDVAGNISIDYKLTKDGRYKLKAFRENQYENPIEGELTKTGMGIIYVRNYNTFRELLSKPVKKDPKPKND